MLKSSSMRLPKRSASTNLKELGLKIKKIYGAPGTGKTRTMLDLLQEEIERGTPLERIAFVTHTVAAKLEAKERIQRVIQIVDEKTQLRYFRTIHGICYVENDLKRDNVMQPEDYLAFGDSVGIPFSSNFTSDVDMDGLPIGFNLSGGNEILAVRQLAAAKRCMVSDIPEEWPKWAGVDIMREVITKYAEWKDKHAKFDFVDMLFLYEKHGEPLDIDVLFIDEAQDLSGMQWAIVKRMMARAERVYIAGDDDQMIYAFIGADRYGFLDFPADDLVVLPKTYRLQKNIWEHAQRIIKAVHRRQEKQVSVRDDGGVVDYYNNDILFFDIDPTKSSMIIARHHFQLQRLAKSLEARGIPYKGRGREVTKTDQAYAVHAYIRARNGEKISLRDASLILRFIGDKKGSTKLRKESRTDPGLLIDKEQLEREFGLRWTDKWHTYLARNRAEVTKCELIDNIIHNIGLDGLVAEPSVSLTTYHGSKGREADHVICFTDCFKSAYDTAVLNPDDERRLAYVGVTRARERLTVFLPTTDLYMRTML